MTNSLTIFSFIFLEICDSSFLIVSFGKRNLSVCVILSQTFFKYTYTYPWAPAEKIQEGARPGQLNFYFLIDIFYFTE